MVYDTDGDLTRFGVHGPWCVPYSALVTLYFFMFPVGGDAVCVCHGLRSFSPSCGVSFVKVWWPPSTSGS